MKSKLSYLVPSALEMVAALFLSVAVMLLAHADQLLNYYGLRTSDSYLHASTAGAVNSVLHGADRYQNTNSIVLFAIWAVVGLLCFLTVDNFGRLLLRAKEQGQVASSRYVHPANFTPAKFWRQFARDVGVTVLCGAALVATFVLLLAALIPIGLLYGRPLLFTFSAVNALDFAIGLAVVFVGVMLLLVSLRLLVQRRRIFNLS